MITPSFGYTIMYVANVSATVAFYERAFGLVKKFFTPDGDYGEMSTGSTTLSFASFEMARSHFGDAYVQSRLQDNPFGVEVALVTPDVEALMQQAIAAGAHCISDIEQKPWGQRVGYVRDINGFLVELCTPLAT